MKSSRSAAIAIVLLEHLSVGLDTEALSGDLLEEFHCGTPSIGYGARC
jgi:hypothetical protein